MTWQCFVLAGNVEAWTSIVSTHYGHPATHCSTQPLQHVHSILCTHVTCVHTCDHTSASTHVTIVCTHFIDFTHYGHPVLQGGEDPQDALSCRAFSAKEPLIIRLFCGKWPVKIRHAMHLRHPIVCTHYGHVNTLGHVRVLREKAYMKAYMDT